MSGLYTAQTSITYSSLYSSADFDSRVIDPSKPVVTIAGTAKVVRSGTHAASSMLFSQDWRAGLSSFVSSGIGSYLSEVGVSSGVMAMYSIYGGGMSSALTGGDFGAGALNSAMGVFANHFMYSSAVSIASARDKLRRAIEADGKLTLEESYIWFRKGKGGDINVLAALIDLDFINPDNWKVGESDYVQTLYLSRDGRVYGSFKIEKVNHTDFKIYRDLYDFNHQEGSGILIWIRNKLTQYSANKAGKGIPYYIYFNGVNTPHKFQFKPVSGYKW